MPSGQLLTADCLDALAGLDPGCAQLIYLDPPFNTQKTQRARHGAYDDAFGGAADYISYVRPRLQLMLRALSADGALFFHCDWRTSHHIRLLLDELFQVTEGKPRRGHAGGVFVNEIIWRYGLGAARARRQLLTKHDVIFWYARSADYVFNLIRDEPTPAMVNKYRHVDENGDHYMLSYGRKYVMRGGKPLDDVWEIPAIAPTSGERVGYPTQKPLALLKRIVQLASNPGDLVLDPFCGSGTTLAAAEALGRRWIGIDANPQAITVATQRLGG